MAEREEMDLLADFFRALNEELAQAGVQKKQLAKLLHLSPSSVSEMFKSGRGGNKLPPSWERIERIVRFCWDKRDHGEFPGMTATAVTAGLKDAQARYMESWRLRHAVLVRDVERARGARVDGYQDSIPAAPVVRYTLPRDTAAFTGRRDELRQVTSAAADAAGTGGVIAIRAIGGMPGIGKTALAVHAAHALREEFPDQQVFINLRAHTPGQEPVRPEDALAGLLSAAGVDPRFLPDDLDGRAAMWRDRMAGRRALLVLDNAASSSQVAPLLPGAGGCLVLVTSRRHLGDLPGTIVPIQLDALSPSDAAAMFVRLAPRAAGDPAGITRVVQLAGFLPLAISLLARVFMRHSSWSLDHLIAETQARLLTLTAEHDNIVAALEVSYLNLEPARQRLFWLLGVNPGTTIDAYAAAALADSSVAEAIDLLDALHGEGLLTETGHRWYGMHDLLRAYARDIAAAAPADDRQRSLHRLLDYYQHAAALAGTHMVLRTRPGPSPASAADMTAFPDLNNTEQALTWARANRGNLIACLDYVTSSHELARVIALTAGLAVLYRFDGPWADSIPRHANAVQAARDLGDQLGEANALTDLASMQRQIGDFTATAQTLDQALDIYRDLGNKLGEANTLSGLGGIRWLTGDLAGAAQVLQLALSTYRDLGDQLGQVHALNALGIVLRATNAYDDALKAQEQALRISLDFGYPLGHAHALKDLGEVRWLKGDYPGAAQALEQALTIYRDLGNRNGQANALNELGIVRQLTGDYLGAAQAQEQALTAYRDLGSKLGQANALTSLGDLRRIAGDCHDATQALEEALSICRDIHDRNGQANALIALGKVQREMGNYQSAAPILEEALDIFRELSNRDGQADVLNEKGNLHRESGELTEAAENHRQALELARTIVSPTSEAHALTGLGRCAAAAGDTTRAEVFLRQAHQKFEHIGAAEAAVILAELTAITGSGGQERTRLYAPRRDS